MTNYHIIDSGNTNLKLACYSKDGHLERTERFESINELGLYLSHNKISKVYCCSVNLEISFDGIEVINLNDHLSKINFKTKYSNSLGIDRLAIAFYLSQKYPNEKISVINAGSFTTIDFIDQSLHLGGYIFPGCQTYLNIYKSGKNLPVLDIRQYEAFDTKIPLNTYEAILNSLAVVNKSILELSLDKSNQIFLTGGNSFHFEGLGIKTVKSENLIFDSLFYIFTAILRH